MADPVGRRDRPITVDEYLALEMGSHIRHEYVDGEMYTMSGVSRRHSKITGNIFARFWASVRGGQCRAHQSDVKLRAGRVVYYPDAMIARGPEPQDSYVEDT